MDYGILKSLHLISVFAWTAGLFYIGRIYVYYVESTNEDTNKTLSVMAQRLSRFIMLPASIFATLIGLHLSGVIHAFSQPWFHLKLTLLFLIFGYQHVCAKFNKQLASGTFNKSSRWCRIFNEIPIVLITGITFSVITKNIAQSIIAMVVIVSFLAFFFFLSRKK